MEQSGVPYLLGKTWTTDAPYREAPYKIALRRQDGCVAVEMEAASIMAVAQFRGATYDDGKTLEACALSDSLVSGAIILAHPRPHFYSLRHLLPQHAIQPYLR